MAKETDHPWVTEQFRRMLEVHPLYVAAVVPPWGKGDPEYTPWFIASTDVEAVGRHRLTGLAEEFAAAHPDADPTEAMDDFVQFLASRDYLILNSPHDHGPGLVVVDVDGLGGDEDEDEEE
jgi:hypothetical protein